MRSLIIPHSVNFQTDSRVSLKPVIPKSMFVHVRMEQLFGSCCNWLIGFHTRFCQYLLLDQNREDPPRLSQNDNLRGYNLSFNITNSRCHDSQIAPIILRASLRVRKSTCYVMDKAYDSERIHQLIHEDLKSQSMIPIRDWHASYVSGKYRQIMASSFDFKIYRRRNMAETVFSILKRLFGETLYSRSHRQQVKEIKLKCIIFSIDRFLKNQRVCNVLWGFQQSHFFNNWYHSKEKILCRLISTNSNLGKNGAGIRFLMKLLWKTPWILRQSVITENYGAYID